MQLLKEFIWWPIEVRLYLLLETWPIIGRWAGAQKDRMGDEAIALAQSIWSDHND